MTQKQRLVLSGFLCIGGALVAVYGAGFSWRQVLVGGIAFLIWQFADEAFKAAYAKPTFTRFQFRICMDHMGRALEAAGLEGDELPDDTRSISENMVGKGWIVFTWLEPELFYINTTHQFASRFELSIDLPPFGSRQSKRWLSLSDIIEVRDTLEGYEVMLLTSEQRYSRSSKRDPGVLLFSLPYKFFWSLQGERAEVHSKATEILASSGFSYHEDTEFHNGSFYQNEYGSFKWWDL